jgi:hypothetical protein
LKGAAGEALGAVREDLVATEKELKALDAAGYVQQRLNQMQQAVATEKELKGRSWALTNVCSSFA